VQQSAARRSVFTLAATVCAKQFVRTMTRERIRLRASHPSSWRKVRPPSRSCNFSGLTEKELGRSFSVARRRSRPSFRGSNERARKRLSLIYSKRNRVSGNEVRWLVTRE